MKRHMLWLMAVAVLGWTASAGAQAPPTPGPEHKMLGETAGTWECTIKMEGMEDSKGVSVNKVDLGGLWLTTEFNGEFAGMKFQGKGMDTYDAAKKKFVSVWVDSMSTTPLMMEGDYDKETKTLTMSGEGPGMDGNLMKYKTTTKHVDKDHHTFTMFMVGADGKDTPMMTIEYARKK